MQNGILLNEKERQLWVDGEEVKLSAKPFMMLCFFVKQPNQLVSIETILANVWPDNIVTRDSVKDYVAVIRRALGDSADCPTFIATVRGAGYRYLGGIEVAPAKNTDMAAGARNGQFIAEKQRPAASLLQQIIPEDITPFVGRAKELDWLLGILNDRSCRLVSIQGPGGIGKTRLAQALCRQVAQCAQQSGGLLGQLPDEHDARVVAMVSLAQASTVEAAVTTIAAALNISLQGQHTPLAQLIAGLRDLSILLVLDSIDRLPADLDFCHTLLSGVRSLKVVITSRDATGLYGEWSYCLTGMSLPAAAQPDSGDSVDLFIQSAQRQVIHFTSSTVDRRHIESICERLGGIPLAIEIAAQWLNSLSALELLESLQQTPQAVVNTLPASRVPAVTIAELMQQYWLSLGREEQRVLCALSLFRGPVREQAALTVAGTQPLVLRALANKSMLQLMPDGRYSVHEVLRDFAATALHNAHQVEHYTQRYVDYYLHLTQLADRAILGGQQFDWIAQLEQEYDNLREVLTLCHGDALPNGKALAIRMVGALGMFWFVANHWREGLAWARLVVSANSRLSTSDTSANAAIPQTANQPESLSTGGSFTECEMDLIIAQSVLGGLCTVTDDQPSADRHLPHCVRVLSQIEPGVPLARALTLLALLRRLQGRYTESIALCEQSLTIFRRLEDDGSSLMVLGCIGQSLIGRQDYDGAIAAFKQSVMLSKQVGHTINLPHALINLGRALWVVSRHSEALAHLQQSLAIVKELGMNLYHAQALLNLGWVECESANFKAAQYFYESGQLHQQLGDRAGLAEALEGLAVCCANNAERDGEAWEAQKLLAAAALLREQIQMPIPNECGTLIRSATEKTNRQLTPTQAETSVRLGRSLSPSILLSAYGAKLDPAVSSN